MQIWEVTSVKSCFKISAPSLHKICYALMLAQTVYAELSMKTGKKTQLLFALLSVYVFAYILLFIELQKPEVTCLSESSAHNFFSYIHLNLYYNIPLQKVLQSTYNMKTFSIPRDIKPVLPTKHWRNRDKVR